MADQAIDYAALAEQARKASGGIDYTALADQARGGKPFEPVEYRNGMPVYSIDVYGRAGTPPQPEAFQGMDAQGKPIIASPPGPPASPIPWGLRKEPEPTLANLDPRTGEFIKTPALGTVPVLDDPFTGGVKMAEGGEEIRNANFWKDPTLKNLPDVLGGGSKIIRGTLEAATPFMVGAGIAAPLPTALTLAAGTGLSAGTEAGLNALGVNPKVSALTSDLVGLFGAHKTLKWLGGIANLPYQREANAIQGRLEETMRRANDPNLSPGDRAAAKAQVEGLMDGLKQAEAGSPGGYFFPSVGGRQLLPGYGKGPSPDSAAAQEVIGLGQKHDVPLMAGDIIQNPSLKSMEVSGEQVPFLGVRKFRVGQQEKVKAAAGKVKSQYEDALINAEPSALEDLQAAAEGGDQRARNVLEKMNQAGNDPDRIIQASIGLGDWTTRQTATGLYDKVQKLAEDHNLGDVPLKATGKAIGSSLEQLRPAKLPNKEVIGLLQKVKESISPKLDSEGNPMLDAEGKPVTPDNSYALIRQLHSDLGERIREYYQGNNALIGEKGVGYLERVQNALEDDMRKYAKESGIPEIVDAGDAADSYYKAARVPYKNGMLAAAATSNEPDQVFQQFIKAGKGDRAKNFYDALDDRGKAAVRYNMVAKAVDDSINDQSGVFSPQKFVTAMNKLDEAYGVFFTAKDNAEIQGFKNLMGHVTRAGQYMENPPTGNRLLPWVVAGAGLEGAKLAAAHPVAGAGMVALMGMTRALLTTNKGRSLLLRAYGIKPGSKIMDSVWEQAGQDMPKLVGTPEKPPGGPPEEPPTGPPTGGGPTPSPTGGGGGTPPEPAPGASNRNAFIDRLKEFLGSEEGASPSRRGRPMGLQELMGQPEKVLGGEEAPRTLKLKPSGKGGELLTSDLGQALENSVAQRYRLGKEASPERRQARGLEAMTADLRYALAEEAKGRGWYTDDVAEMERHLKQARPEFKDPNTMGLFKYLLGITSNGVDPELNFDAALRGWDLYKRDGKFSAYDASRASEFGNPKGTGLTFRANSYASAMDRMTKLVEDKGEAGALEWLRTKHPVSELKQYYEDVPGKATDERYGSYIFGEKVGSFGANLNGIHTELTADKWWSRSWNRWMGTLMDTDKEGNVRFDKESGNPLLQDDPRNETERNLMRDTAAQVAKDLGLQVSELQAILWYAEQRLYRFYGIDASSVSYADAARKQFGTVRPSQNAVDSGPAKSGGTDAQPRKGGRSPAKVPEELPGSGAQRAVQEVVPSAPGAKKKLSEPETGGVWVSPNGEVRDIGPGQHAQLAEKLVGSRPEVPGKLRGSSDWQTALALVDRGWLRVRDYNVTAGIDALKAGGEPLMNAVNEAFRGGDGGSVLIETPKGAYAWVTQEEKGDFLKSPIRFMRKYWREQVGGEMPDELGAKK